MGVRWDRRRALGLMVAGSWAGRAWGQTPATPEITPGPTVTPAPLTIPGLTPPAPAPAPRPPAAASSIDKTKAYYVFFSGTIDEPRTQKLRVQLATLVEAGVTDITVALSSPGGQLDPTILTYSYIRSLPVPIKMHAQGFVLSAATVLLLAGEHRLGDHTARFLFHPAQSALTPGAVGEPQLRDRLVGFQMVEEVVAQIYHERTRLTAEQVLRFQQETVVMSPAEAAAAGMIEAVEDLRVPPGTAKMLFVE